MNNYKNQIADELYKAVKELNECLNSSKLDAVLHRYEDGKDRQTGRTTILYMKAIVKALENPSGMEVEFIDHYEHNVSNVIWHKRSLEDIIEKLQLNLIVRQSGCKIFLFKELLGL
jgi:hypothetical protein